MLTAKDIILRDFRESDIETRIHWENVETEWQLWDGPWEYEGLTDDEREQNMASYLKNMRKWATMYKDMPDSTPRTQFQIETLPDHRYIGWVSSYRIDSDYTINPDGEKCAVGIDIPDMASRGHGYAAKALCLFIEYLLKCGEKEIYTQTWSGNVRMIGLAHKLGFIECRRKKDLRTVRGDKYDGLTFGMDMALFRKAFESVLGRACRF